MFAERIAVIAFFDFRPFDCDFYCVARGEYPRRRDNEIRERIAHRALFARGKKNKEKKT